MDENNPENVFAFISYLSREQYGDRPLVKGQYFNAPLDRREPYQDGSPVWWPDPETGKYIITDDKKQSIPNYDDKFQSVFPRMYSDKKNHIRAYKEWSGFKGGDRKPTMTENLRFFFSYQIHWMYTRYFLWNFAGRQNDSQGHGNMLDGNWVSGLSFLDEHRVGSQDEWSESMKNNKAYNRLYCLPLLLGLVGLFFHMVMDRKGFSVVMILFLLTGIGIIVFLNQYPYQPRERDYAYAASFYAFAIWIGLGVMGLFELLKKYIPGHGSAFASILVSAAVPAIMVSEEWDDHDRSGLYTARDFAANYLNSCAPNAILFTNGDNDTFPLWYAQEVEGIRTDVRVMNLSLSNTDWYIDQMSRKAYKSDPVPFSMTAAQYRQGTRDYVPFYDANLQGYTDLKQIMDFVKSESPKAKIKTQSGKWLNYMPTKKFSLSVPKQKVLSNGTVKPELADQIVPNLLWEKKGNYVLKNSLMQLDMLQNNDWERPIYFAITVGGDAYLQLENYFQLEGLAYRLVPIRTNGQGGQTGRVDTDIMYDNVMNKFNWGGMEGDVYMGETNMRMTYNLRNNFARLADALLKEGKTDSAIAVLDKCIEVMPDHSIPYNFFMTPVAEAYYRADEIEKANLIMVRLMEIYESDLSFYLSLSRKQAKKIKAETERAMSVFQRLIQIARAYKQDDLHTQLKEKFTIFQTDYQHIQTPPAGSPGRRL
jgi:tetratricopeptide (TPR) repeat protein